MLTMTTLKEADKDCILACLNETNGYAGNLIKSFIDNEDIEIFYSKFKEKEIITLEKEQWIKINNLIHATIHTLGQEELSTITGFSLVEHMNAARKIFCAVHNQPYGYDFI